MRKIKILNVHFDACTKEAALVRIFDVLKNPHQDAKHIVTPNPEMLLEAQKNKKFEEILNDAWLSIPDGIGILWAATFQSISHKSSHFLRYVKGVSTLCNLAIHPDFFKKIFPERITGVDLMESLCARSCDEGISIFLLGAGPGVAEKTKIMLQNRYHGLHIVGTYCGSPRPEDEENIRARINAHKPAILFVAFGAPAQELWINRNLSYLPSIKIAMGVGGAFDFIANVRRRAPEWMQRVGVEWLYRLIQEPRRIKRIYNATIRFPLEIIK